MVHKYLMVSLRKRGRRSLRSKTIGGRSRNADGEPLRTAYRHTDASKYFERGDKRGLVYRHPLPAYAGPSEKDPVFVCEGASDTAALLGLNLDAVGGPMAGQCGAMLADLLRGRHTVILRDRDDAGEVMGALSPLRGIAATGAEVLLIHHPRKGESANYTSGLRSGSLSAFPDVPTF